MKNWTIKTIGALLVDASFSAHAQLSDRKAMTMAKTGVAAVGLK